MTRFIILTVSRTGSTHLYRALNKHPEIVCDEEIFSFSGNSKAKNRFRYIKIPLLGNATNYLLNYPLIKLRLHNFLDKFFKKSSKNHSNAKGFKLRYNQLVRTPGIIDYIKENKIKIIFLQRENIFQHAVACMRANSRGITYKKEAKGIIDDVPRFKINISMLKKVMTDITEQNRRLHNIVEYTEHITIDHEELKNWGETMKRLERFLNVSEEDMTNSLRKVSDDSTSEMIINMNEVSAWLENNGYAKFASKSA